MRLSFGRAANFGVFPPLKYWLAGRIAESSTTFRQSLAVFREGVFARYMVAEFISMAGSWMQTQAQQLEVEKQASSSLEQALISAAMMAIIPIFGPWGGSVADRADKRMVLFIALAVQAALALATGWLVHAGMLSMWHLAAFSVLLGISAAFEMPAYSALLPELVPKEKLGAAVAVDRSVFHAARILGPTAAGLLVAVAGRAAAFFANAFSFLFPILVLMTIPRRTLGTAEQEAQRRSGFGDGLRYCRRDVPTRRMLLICAANTFFCSPFVIILLTWYGRRTLALGEMEIGWLMSLSGIGALSASLFLLAIPPARRMRFLRIGAATAVVAMLVLASARGFWLPAVAVSALTLGLNFLFGISNQLIQERAPDELRGRVSAVAAMSFVAVIPVSGIATAALETWLGMRTALTVCAVGYAVAAAWLLRGSGEVLSAQCVVKAR